VPKVTRANSSRSPRKGRKGGASPASGRSARNTRRAPAPPAFLSHVRNRASAALRAAHYRTSAAARLVSIVCVLVIGGAVLILMGFGRMEHAAAWAGAAADEALRGAGFRLETVDVVGAEAASFDQIREALAADSGHSIFALDLEQARARVEALDWVGDARVFRLLPNRIQVVVNEQTPLARWQIDGAIVVIDVNGQPINTAASPDGAARYAALPLVVGEGAAGPAPALIAALRQFPDVAGHVEAAQRVGERRWTLFLDSGAQLHLPETDGEAALAIVSELQARRGLLSAPAESIDLRNPDQIVVRPLPEDAPDGADGRPRGREA